MQAIFLANRRRRAQSWGMKCEWPGCSNDALCSSGNVGGALVCDEHFAITNGKAESELSQEEIAAMTQMAEREKTAFVDDRFTDSPEQQAARKI